MKNDILKFREAVENANSILLVPHLSPDGDAIGSLVALKCLIEKLGKTADLLVNEPISKKYDDFEEFITVLPSTDTVYDLVVYVDCGEKSRACVEFPEPKKTACIDHHISNSSYCDINIIDAVSPATGEIVYEIFCELGILLDELSAKAIYMAILCDTGGFIFDNTRKRTFEVIAELYDFDFSKYETVKKTMLTKTLTYNKLSSRLIDGILIIDDVAIGSIDYETYKAYNVSNEDTDGLSNVLRNIEGINCGILLTEKEEGITKGSVRTDKKYNANEIAKVFSGGGHLRAAGFRVNLKPDEVKEKINEWLSCCK